MMDFHLTQEQELFRQTVHEFAEKNIAPRGREIDDKAQGIPEEILQGMAKLGLFGRPLDKFSDNLQGHYVSNH